MASIYGPVSATGWQLRLDYTVSQDAANNRSALALTLYIPASAFCRKMPDLHAPVKSAELHS